MRDRVGIITGASSGIGAAVTRVLAPQYGGLVLHARKSADALERVANEARASGARVVTFLGDLSSATIGSELISLAETSFGQLDTIVANAGFPILKPFEQGTIEDIEHGFRGNLFSFFSLAQKAERLLRASKSGRIVAVGSFTAHVFRTDIRQFPLSAASKGALEVAVRSLALHLASSNVTVNCVVPGFIEKDFGTEDGVSDAELQQNRARIPLGRAGRPADVAQAINFLQSEAAEYITGQSLHVNGGLYM